MNNTSNLRYFNTETLQSLQLNSTSKGNQSKWYELEERLFIKKQFEYQDKFWRDDLVEIIASEIAKQMPIEWCNITVVEQKPCILQENGKEYSGVYSKDFIAHSGKFFSFQKLVDCTKLRFPENGNIEEKWNFILMLYDELCHLNITDYLIVMSLIDYLVGNEDRHLNNFGCISKGKGVFSFAPLFDFGLGLFEHDRRYEGVPFRKCLSLMEAKPFSPDNQEVIDFLQDNYDIKRYLPKTFDLSHCQIPSPKASSYLLNRCHQLNITLQGVE